MVLSITLPFSYAYLRIPAQYLVRLIMYSGNLTTVPIVNGDLVLGWIRAFAPSTIMVHNMFLKHNGKDITVSHAPRPVFGHHRHAFFLSLHRVLLFVSWRQTLS